MKITKSHLKQIVLEEVHGLLQEDEYEDDYEEDEYEDEDEGVYDFEPQQINARGTAPDFQSTFKPYNPETSWEEYTPYQQEFATHLLKNHPWDADESAESRMELVHWMVSEVTPGITSPDGRSIDHGGGFAPTYKPGVHFLDAYEDWQQAQEEKKTLKRSQLQDLQTEYTRSIGPSQWGDARDFYGSGAHPTSVIEDTASLGQAPATRFTK